MNLQVCPPGPDRVRCVSTGTGPFPVSPDRSLLHPPKSPGPVRCLSLLAVSGRLYSTVKRGTESTGNKLLRTRVYPSRVPMYEFMCGYIYIYIILYIHTYIHIHAYIHTWISLSHTHKTHKLHTQLVNMYIFSIVRTITCSLVTIPRLHVVIVKK